MNVEPKDGPAAGRVRIPVVGMAVLFVVLCGLVADANKADGDNFYANLIRLDKVAKEIHQKYVERISSADLVDKAVEGMLAVLDAHTSYFQEKQYQELQIQTQGEFGGLGIQIAIRDKVLTVMTPIAGTPAARAGIQSGDQILSIDGKSTEGITIDEAVSKLRGQPGTEVTIVIRRRDEPKDIEYRITREVIKIKSVPFYGMLADGIGYVRLVSFSQESGTELEKALRDLAAKNVLHGVVVDLRHNPGGLLPQAIDVAEKFLPKKALVVSTRGREPGQNREYYATVEPILRPDIPLVIMVDRASASASEIVAGAIQDWDRGVILGDTTFGKGSVQSILPLDAEHKLKLTTAFYYTPSGRCINKPENDVRGADGGDKESEPEEGTGREPDRQRQLRKQSGRGSGADSAGGRQKDTTVYRTFGGRVVRGGGGIIPDTIVQAERLSPVIVSLLTKDLFFKFVNVEYPRLKKLGVTVGQGYVPDDATIKRFREFLDSMKFEYRTAAQMKFNEFKKQTGLVLDSSDTSVTREPGGTRGGEKFLTGPETETLRTVVARIDLILAEASARALREEEAEIKRLIGEWMLVRARGQDDEVVFRTRLAADVQVRTAANILKDRKVYDSLLKPKIKLVER